MSGWLPYAVGRNGGHAVPLSQTVVLVLSRRMHFCLAPTLSSVCTGFADWQNAFMFMAWFAYKFHVLHPALCMCWICSRREPCILLVKV
jgi:hypothetical protein